MNYDEAIDDLDELREHYPRLLLPIHNKFEMKHFKKVIEIVFDIPDNLHNPYNGEHPYNGELYNGLIGDLISTALVVPPETEDKLINYYQLLTYLDGHYIPCYLNIVSCLFDEEDMYGFEWEDVDRDALEEFYTYIRNKYKTINDYTRRIAYCLDLSDREMANFHGTIYQTVVYDSYIEPIICAIHEETEKYISCDCMSLVYKYLFEDYNKDL